MIKAYYTKLNIIDLSLYYDVRLPDRHLRIKIPMSARLVGEDPLETIYESVKQDLLHEDFFLVPSQEEVELQAYRDDQQRHPHKYPNDGSSIGGLLFGQDD